MPPFKEEAEGRPSPDAISWKTLHDAIPPQMFERSALRSTLHLIENIFYLAVTFSVTYYWLNYLCPAFLYWPTVVLYTLVQGTIFTGIWVIAHECGHQAYSSSDLINDTVGLILHGTVLIPFYAWRLSHNMHHRYVANLDKDVVFLPLTKSQYYKDSKSKRGERATDVVKEPIDQGEDTMYDDDEFFDIPIVALGREFILMVVMLVAGLPMYFMFNTSGRSYEKGIHTHYSSRSPIFHGQYKKGSWLANGAVAIGFSVLAYLAYKSSVSEVLLYYFAPWVIVNAWITMITYLHHTDPRIPYYRDNSWTHIKGALSTMDRDYGRIINHLHHHIADTHVSHHFFPKIPHYNAVEVTKIIKPILGPYYKYDDTFFLKSFYNSFIKCRYMPDKGSILYYKSEYQVD